MARKLLCPAALLLALTLIFTGCSVKKVNNIPSSEQVSAFGDFKHYFGELNENEKRAYNAILRDIESFPEEIEIPELNNEELEKVWLAVMYDNPELIMLGRECMLVSRDRKFWFSCEYAMTKDEYEQKKAELQTKADELGAKIVKETSDFDKELLIHDAIIDSCKYTDSDKLIASSAYGVLVNGSASCEGYAKAAKLLLDKAGIENYVITGTAKREDGASEGHMWNVVFIDGKPYNLRRGSDADQTLCLFQYYGRRDTENPHVFRCVRLLHRDGQQLFRQTRQAVRRLQCRDEDRSFKYVRRA